jgi:hypothetical protein
MRLEPGESRTGYIAFRVDKPKANVGLNEVRVDSESGTMVFTDNVTLKPIRTLAKNPQLFLG